MAIRVYFLPSKAIADLKKMPEDSGVYYMTALWQLFYVGKAVNLRKRLTARHQRYKQIKLLVPFARIHYRILPKHQISGYERSEILSLQPKWNYTRVPEFWGLFAQFIGFWLCFWFYLSLVAIALGYLGYLLYQK